MIELDKSTVFKKFPLTLEFTLIFPGTSEYASRVDSTPYLLCDLG